MNNWSSLLSSKCEDRDLFLSFYSKTKGTLHKLIKGNSIVAKDGVFSEGILLDGHRVQGVTDRNKRLPTGHDCHVLRNIQPYPHGLQVTDNR